MAAASKVILLARRQQVLSSAVAELTKKSSGFSCSISGFECNMSDPAAVNALWDKLEGDGVEIDILALSAASNGRSAQILEMGSAEIWKVYEMNVRGNLLFAERFAQHTQRSRLEFPKVLLNVSSMGIHDRQIAPQWGTYVSSKSAFAMLLQNIASEIPKNVMQIISFHPGGIYSETQSKICEKDSWEWDDDCLPGHFAVWLATPSASFLHGRFVWANWDVEELLSEVSMQRILNDPDFLRVGVNGL